MANTAFKGTPVHTVGELPAPGTPAPAFTATGATLAEVTLTEGTRTILNIFPSVDTGVCAMSVRKFNELAAGLENTQVVCVSADLPFALGRFCGADYGMTMTDGPLRGLLARSVVVVDADGSVLHSQVVPEITTEPDYDAAIAALG